MCLYGLGKFITLNDFDFLFIKKTLIKSRVSLSEKIIFSKFKATFSNLSFLITNFYQLFCNFLFNIIVTMF